MPSARSFQRVVFRRFTIACSVLTVFMVGTVVAVNYVFDLKLNDITRVNVATAPERPQGSNFLLIGSDTHAFVSDAADQKAFGSSAQEGGQRSDSMMVVHVEPGQQRILVVSFPRDLWVDIPGSSPAKINSAFNTGPDLVIQTLKQDFGVDINHYVEVDFKSFQDIVSAIGSVPVYFPYPAHDQKTGLLIPVPGCKRLDGPTALAYVRSRGLEYFSTTKKQWVSASPRQDIDRIGRQQAFIRSIASLAVQKSLNDPITLNDISNSVIKNLKVDDGLSNDEMKSLIDAFRTINPNDPNSVDMRTFAWKSGPDEKGQSVLYPDTSQWPDQVALLNDFSGGKSNPTATVAPSSVKVRVLNATGADGTAEAVLNELKTQGFKDGGAGNDTRGTVPLSEVRYAPDALTKAKLVLQYFGPDTRFVNDPSLARGEVVVVLGADFKAVVVPSSSGSAATTGATTTTAPNRKTTSPAVTDQIDLGTPAPKTPPCT